MQIKKYYFSLKNNKVIPFDVIKVKVIKINKNKKCRALMKFTDKHINPSDFGGMNVKFSHSVAASVRTYRH